MKELLPFVTATLAGLGPLKHFFEGKRILLTGARGFLGRQVVACFVEMNKTLAKPCEVLAVDTVATPVEEWRNVPNISFHVHDVMRGVGVIPGKLDYVLHLAGIASPYWYKKKPLETIAVAVSGSRHMLDLAKEHKATYLFTSSSEVYQTASIVPTPESYVGAIPSMNDRSCYDVSKLMAETLAYTYAGMGVDTRVIRIFNSVLGDEPVVFSDASGLHVMRADEAAVHLGLHGDAVGLAGVSVPSIDPHGGKSEQHRAAHLIGHAHSEECLQIDTHYGRSIRITKDHSLFTAGKNGEIVATRGGDLKVRDRIALAGRIEVPSTDRASISTIDAMLGKYAPEDIAVYFAGLDAALVVANDAVVKMRIAGGYAGFAARSQTKKDTERARTSLDVLNHLNVSVPHAARISLKSAGCGKSTIPATIEVTADLLWVMGLFVAEGCFVKTPGSHAIVFSSDTESIQRAARILTTELGVHVGLAKSPSGAPTARVCSNVLFAVWRSIGLIDGLAHTKRIPAWIMALPLARLKYFLDGYRAGDGVHSGKKVGNYHEFSTVSEGLKNDLIVALGRFGLVPSTGKYVSTIKKYPGKKYPFWRITLGNVTPWDMLEWDKGATQKLNAYRTGDVVWAQVKKITPIPPTEKVYDFSVPGLENFITGRGVMAHNSFAPGMAESDRRILPRIASAMRANRKLTVYGREGHLPRRTYTPAANTLLGLFYVLLKGKTGEVYNVGNDAPEVTVPDLLHIIGQVTGLDPRWELVPPPSHYETEPMRRCPDITKLKGLGYRPAMELGAGLKCFFDWALDTYSGAE
jgi:UDP-glucuronate decarboxylase